MPTEDDIYNALRRAFGEDCVRRLFDVARNSADDYIRDDMYTPILDFAVCPFNLDRNKSRNLADIQDAFTRYSGTINAIVEAGYGDIRPNFNFNANPRVFMAVEAENTNSRKHRLGSIINASLLGKVGVVVGLNQKTYRSLYKIKAYLDFVKEFKSIPTAGNVVIISATDLLRVLQ